MVGGVNVLRMMDELELMIERIHQLRAIRSSVTVRSDQNIHKQEEKGILGLVWCGGGS